MMPITASLLMACGRAPAGELFVPTYAPMNAFPAGAIEGTLVIDDGCVWIDSGPERSLVLWPDGTTVAAAGDGFVIRQGGRQLPVGPPTRLGGGQYQAEHFDFVVELIGEEIPPACQASGTYWLAVPLEAMESRRGWSG